MANRRPLVSSSTGVAELSTSDYIAAALVSGLATVATSGLASDLTGTLADARLSSNVALYNGSTAFTAAQTINVTSGTIQTWQIAAATKMMLDGSGNLGIGVTPTANKGLLQIGNASTTIATGAIAWGPTGVPDIFLYRSAVGATTLKAVGSGYWMQFNVASDSNSNIKVEAQSTLGYVGTTNAYPLVLGANGGATLTLDSATTNATFAGNVTNGQGGTTTLSKITINGSSAGAGAGANLTIQNAGANIGLVGNVSSLTGGAFSNILALWGTYGLNLYSGSGGYLAATFGTTSTPTATFAGKITANGAAASSTMTGMTLAQLITYLQGMIQ